MINASGARTIDSFATAGASDLPRQDAVRSAVLALGALLLLGLGAVLSYKLAGRFALSNLAQLLALGMAVMAAPKWTAKRVLIIGSWMGSVYIAAFIQYWASGIIPSLAHMGFFACMTLLAERLLATMKEQQDAATRAYDIMLVVLGLYFLAWTTAKPEPHTHRISFGFDDKSHAAIYIPFFAFLALLRIRRWYRYFFAASLLAASMMTTSRLSVIFLPFLILAGIIDAALRYGRINRKILALCVVALVALSTGSVLLFPERFKIVERMNPAALMDGAMRSHFLLIQYALEAKFESVYNFIFGIGAGKYAEVLTQTDIDLSALAALDPQAHAMILQGTAPVHSTHATVLLEFPIWIFVAYAVLLVAVLRRLLQRRMWIELLLFIPLQASVTFYSSINECFYYVIMIWFVHISGQSATESRQPGFSLASDEGDPGLRLSRRGRTQGAESAASALLAQGFSNAAGASLRLDKPERDFS